LQEIDMRPISFLLLGALSAPGFVHAANCPPAGNVQPLRPTVLAPVASELAAMVGSMPGTPNGVLSHNVDANESVDQVLLRIQIESCRNMATAIPAPGVVNPNDPAAYKPRTEFDNTPWRFNMSQNGKKMTADEFSAWMAARGVRVARGAGAAAGAATPVGATPTQDGTPTPPADATQAPAPPAENPPPRP
jgi:hypothetical protein